MSSNIDGPTLLQAALGWWRHVGKPRENQTLATKTMLKISKWFHKTLRCVHWVSHSRSSGPISPLFQQFSVQESELNKQINPLLDNSLASESTWCFVVRVKVCSRYKWKYWTHIHVTKVWLGSHWGGCAWILVAFGLGHFQYQVKSCLSFPLPKDPACST